MAINRKLMALLEKQNHFFVRFCMLLILSINTITFSTKYSFSLFDYTVPQERQKNPQNQILNWKNYKVEPYGQNKPKNKHKKWENKQKICINCLLCSLLNYKAPKIGGHFVGHIGLKRKKSFFEISTIFLWLQPFRIYMVLRCFRHF